MFDHFALPILLLMQRRSRLYPRRLHTRIQGAERHQQIDGQHCQQDPDDVHAGIQVKHIENRELNGQDDPDYDSERGALSPTFRQQNAGLWPDHGPQGPTQSQFLLCVGTYFRVRYAEQSQGYIEQKENHTRC